MQIEFGIFDHTDRGIRPPREIFDMRLRLAERYDRAGFHAYYVAEHHGTSLSVSPSPNLTLAAVAARTTRLRIGAMVYVLPLYNMLRLIEEIAMLDQLSGGRLEIGVGRGVVPFELALYGVNHLDAMDIYKEALEVLMAGLTQPVLNHRGHYYKYLNVPMEMAPLQKPHPPLWYGCHYGPETTVWPAQANCNIALLQTADNAWPMVERFTAEWHKAHGGTGKPFPLIGLTRTLVIARDTRTAEERGRHAYASYYASMNKLWQRYGGATAHFPSDFDIARKGGGIIAGTAPEVRAELERQLEVSGVNYAIVRFAFGDLTEDEVVESLTLFTEEIMPHFRARPAHAAQ